MPSQEELEELIARVWPKAEALGLDPGYVHFELVDQEFIQLVVAHGGLPLRYGHWSFGQSHKRIKTAYDFRLTQVYELVVHHEPAYAFIDRATSSQEALLIVAHVLAHADFFRHHRGFQFGPPDMINRAARHRRQMDAWRRRYGDEAVDSLLDAAHVLADFTGDSLLLHAIGESPDDVLGMVWRYAPRLDDWEREALMLTWREARYFWPQQVTKIANEGFATFCHNALLRELALDGGEAWETARLNARIVRVTPSQLNPYRIGYLCYRHAYESGGWAAVWQARQVYDDVGLVRAFFSEDLVAEAGLAVFSAAGDPESGRDHPAKVRRQLLQDLDRAGLPRVSVEAIDGPELVLRHHHDGRDLDFQELPWALKQVAERLWKGPVTLLTERQRVRHRVTHDGREWRDEVG
ncbi:MAG: SpoVR family protein [Firmicutes bacterium]|nr:SpoVR family protein [Bacillota bacterium]